MIEEYSKYITAGIGRYGVAIILFSLGYIMGELVIILWYCWALFLFARRDFEGLLGLLLMWIFLMLGAYHYGMLGESKSGMFVNRFDELLIVLLGVTLLLSKKQQSDEFKIFHVFGKWLVGLTTVSAVINVINPIDLFNYFTSSFRWLIIILMASVYPMEKEKSAGLVGLFFGIIIVNSVFGFLQTIVLPIQTTPDGYTPHMLDVASGFLGVTNGQILTVFCIGLFYFFFYRFLILKDMKTIPFMVLLLLQPFFSSSKAALAFMGSVLIISIFQMNRYIGIRIINIAAVMRILIVGMFVTVGIFYYLSFNDQYVNTWVQLADYFGKKQAITDFAKVQGYIEAFTIVAPLGNTGVVVGVGPTQFTSGVGSKNKSELMNKLKLDVEGNKVSSADFKSTDMTGIIGELGIAGFILYNSFFISLYLFWLKRARTRQFVAQRIYSFFIAQWIISIMIFTYYDDGWFSIYFYTPLLFMMIHDLKWNN